MSQLSFASFFDLAKEAAPVTPITPITPVKSALPAVNAQPIQPRIMTIEEYRRQFVSVFMDTARNLRRWEVFSDFVTLAASELDMARIRTLANIEQSREICEKYSESGISNLHTLFVLMVCALEAKFHDFLGAIFMQLELGEDRNGQYFTPYNVQSLLAKLLRPDIEETIRQEGFVTVSDPASGAAGMIVAYAEELLAAGYNPSEHMFGSCIDIDPIAADMAFIQLSLLGIPAEVVTGNTLTMQLNRVRYTPVYYLNDFEKRLADLRRFRAMRDFMRGIQEAT